jgi:hypothetical protein
MAALCTPALADPIIIFGVAVYIVEGPPCPGGDPGRDVRAQVSPFEEQAQLSEIVLELARGAREAGANTLHSIRVVSAAPYRGAEAVGVAATCPPQSNAVPDIQALVAGSRTAEAFEVRATDALGPGRTLANAQLTPIRKLADAEVTTLKMLIAREGDAKSGASVLSSCPFIPDLGFRLGGDGTLWWLVSYAPGCEAAVLMLPDADWRRQPRATLSPAAVSQVRTLAKR